MHHEQLLSDPVCRGERANARIDSDRPAAGSFKTVPLTPRTVGGVSQRYRAAMPEALRRGASLGDQSSACSVLSST